MTFNFKKLFLLFLLFLNYLLCIIIKIYIKKYDDKNKINFFNELFKIYSTLYFTAKDGKTLRPSDNYNYIINIIII
jgi:hypothetical protein